MYFARDGAPGETVKPDGDGSSYGFDPWSPEFREDPYPYYRRIRGEEPVLEFRPGIWVITRYDLCSAVLRDHRRFGKDVTKSSVRATPGVRPGRPVTGLADRVGTGIPLMTDPPDHTRLRGLVQQAFTARSVERLRPRIQEHVDRLLERMEGKAEVDLVQEFAHPLPLWVICELLGVPRDDWKLLLRWSDDLWRTIETSLQWRVTGDLAKRTYRAIREFSRYLGERLEERRTDPRDDLLTGLMAAELGGSKLTRGELIAMVITLLIGGHETTVNLISNAVLHLLAHHDQLQLFKSADQALLRSAVEEFLRFDAAVQNAGRVVREDIDIGGKELRKGHLVVVAIGAANRDPDQFPEPDRFEITHQDNRHLSFGLGIHRCIGASLSQTEVEIAVSSLFRRFPDLRLGTEGIERRETLVLRGPKRLPIALG
jgi:pimeloyl-[acyl-carrier protein] synthase